MTWGQLLELLETEGPSQVIARVREADENVEPGRFRGKMHDDASAVLCRLRARATVCNTDMGVTHLPEIWQSGIAHLQKVGIVTLED